MLYCMLLPIVADADAARAEGYCDGTYTEHVLL
jgi:hypothetical protein